MPKTSTDRIMRQVRSLVGEVDRDDTPDGQLLARFVDQRDEGAFDLLVHRYGRLVFGVCRRVLLDPHSAEDAFQATFLVLVRKASSLDRNRPVADWLYTVAFRLACRARVNAHRRRVLENNAVLNRPTHMDASNPDDRFEIVHEELTRLPELHRMPLVLSYLEGRTYEQVAREIGCPLGTVGWRLTQAKEALRNRLLGRGIACSTAAIGTLITSSIANATVPASLVETTVRAGLWFSGEKLASAASAQVIDLARSLLVPVSFSKWALAAGVLLAVGLCGGSAWVARSVAMSGPTMPTVEEKLNETPMDAVTKDLPNGTTARMGTTQFRHGEAIFFIAYSADGKQLLTAGKDSTIRLWDRATGQEIRQFERASLKKEQLDTNSSANKAMMNARKKWPIRDDSFPVGVSMDGKILAGGKDRTITVWDVTTGKTIHQLSAAAPVFELVFTPDGKALVSLDTDQNVAVWDLITGKMTKSYAAKSGSEEMEKRSRLKLTDQAIENLKSEGLPESVVKKLASVKNKDLSRDEFVEQITKLLNEDEFKQFENIILKHVEKTLLISSAVSPTGSHLVQQFLDGVTVNSVLRITDLTTEKSRPDISLSVGGAQNITFSADGKLLAWSTILGGITVWDMQAGREIAKLANPGPKPETFIQSIRLSMDGKTLAVIMADETLELWDVGSGKSLRKFGATEGEGSTSTKVDRAVKVVIAGLARPQRHDLTFSSDGKTIALSMGNATVRQFETASGKEINATDGHLSSLIAVGSDGQRVVSVSRESVRVWNPKGGAMRHWSISPLAMAAGIALDARKVATSSINGLVQIWDTDLGKVAREIETKRADVVALTFSPDGKFLATKAQLNAAVNLWDATTGKHVRTIGQDGESLLNLTQLNLDSSGMQTPAIVFSSDGRLLATAGDKKQLTAWDVATGVLVGEFALPTGQSGVAIGFSPNAHLLALLTNTGEIVGYELGTSEKRFSLKPSSGDNSSSLYAADAMSGAFALNAFTRGNANAGTIGFTPDGRFILAATGKPIIRVWDSLTGQESSELKGHNGSVTHFQVSPDGRTLISGSVDTTALMWDLSSLIKVEIAREMPLSTSELESLWAELAKSDPYTAFAATQKLLTDRKPAVHFLSERLRPVPMIEEAQLNQLVAALGGSFSDRRKATTELERLGEMAVPQLRKTIEGNPSLDLKQRIETLLQKATVNKLQGDRLRERRSVELLELEGSAEAKHVLKSLATGAEGAGLTCEAKAALSRLELLGNSER
jgi:RNA polymerase sigma factor (sigma-70 family)